MPGKLERETRGMPAPRMKVLTGIALLLLVVAVANLYGWAVHTSSLTGQEHVRYCSAAVSIAG